MSDTPRTDALLTHGLPSYHEHRKLCGQLERELAEAQRMQAHLYDAAEAGRKRIAELEQKLDEAAAQLAAFEAHHCESEGCAVEGLYKPIAAEWADKYQAMKKRIAELEELNSAMESVGTRQEARIMELEQKLEESDHLASVWEERAYDAQKRIAELEQKLGQERMRIAMEKP